MIRVFNEWRYRRWSLGVNKAFDSHRSVFSRMFADYLLKGRGASFFIYLCAMQNQNGRRSVGQNAPPDSENLGFYPSIR